jgi:hypothetical protein
MTRGGRRDSSGRPQHGVGEQRSALSEVDTALLLTHLDTWRARGGDNPHAGDETTDSSPAARRPSPASSSRLDQVERWFAYRTEQLRHRGSHTGVKPWEPISAHG